MKAVCIIPARGGSKRIPRKNITPFCGKPMIAYAIDCALRSGLFEQVIVSTDDDEIAVVSRTFGAHIPFMRPASLADDHTSSDDVIIHALETLQAMGHVYEFACSLYPTTPLLRPSHLMAGFEALKSHPSALYAFSVQAYTTPIERALRLRGEGVVMQQPEFELVRTQDIKPSYHDAGAFYFGRAQAFLAHQPIFAPHSVPIILQANETVDIDTPDDWAHAEALFRVLKP